MTPISHPAPRPRVSETREQDRRAWLLSDAARPLRFGLTGAAAAAIQLVALALLTRHGWPELRANAVAFVLAAQANFALSATFTWRGRASGIGVWRRWLLFHGSIAGMAVLNMLVFVVAHSVVPTLAASAAGIGAAAIGNFVAGDRLVFRPGALPTASHQGAREPATR